MSSIKNSHLIPSFSTYNSIIKVLDANTKVFYEMLHTLQTSTGIENYFICTMHRE